MPLFQISSRYNKERVNTVLESNSLSNAMLFFSSLSLSTIIEVKKYIYIPTPSASLYIPSSRYATVKFKKDGFQQIIKIPSLKPNVNEVEISNYINTIYTNISDLSISIKIPN